MNASDLNKILSVLSKRYKKNFKKVMSLTQKRALIKDLKSAYEEERLVYKVVQNKLQYFYLFEKKYFGEFEEYFFWVKECFCGPSRKYRNEFYRKMSDSGLLMKKKDKVKSMAVSVDEEDIISSEHFSAGTLTYIELIGETKTGLSVLSKTVRADKEVSIHKLKKEDINKLVKLDISSHIADKTSRMRKIFMKPKAEVNLRKFYKMLMKNGGCYVAKVNGKLAGDIGYFLDKKIKLGFIACIFVSNEYKGRNISKMLYKKVLEEFRENRLDQYMGATTTTGVLGSGQTYW